MEKTKSERVEEVLSRIQEQSQRLVKIAAQSMPVGASMCYIDFLVIGAAKRTLNLTSAFSMLVRSVNMIAARAILRMQLDTAVRFSAIAIVEDPNRFARDIFEGQEIRKLKSRDGKPLTDKYLVDQLSHVLPWLSAVYRDTSGYVHFSATSIFAGIVSAEEATHKVYFRINDLDEKFPESTWLELTKLFERMIAALIGLVTGWIERVNGGRRT